MTTGLKDLRALIERGRTASGQLRSETRGEVVDLIERARGAGTSYREIASAVGVKFQTLMSWRAQQKSTALVPVRVVMPSRSVIVHGPGGLRVEGLSLDELVALWSRLST